MPFDGTPTITETPSLEALSYALRHLDEVLPGFKWDYTEYKQCAMGAAFDIWAEVESPDEFAMMRVFGISEEDADHLFLNLDCALGLSRPGYADGRHLVRPEHVADAIDAFLASRA